MKETLNDLKTRRSCRAYRPEQIKKNELEAVLEAGTYAPSGMGKQGSMIVVVQDQDLIKKISKMNADIMGADMDPFYGAPTVLVVFSDTEIPTYRDDGALVIGNILNAAHAVGLGSCMIYRAREVFSTDEGKAMKKKWGVPDSYEGIGNCVIGYAAEGGIEAAAPRKADYIIRV